MLKSVMKVRYEDGLPAFTAEKSLYDSIERYVLAYGEENLVPTEISGGVTVALRRVISGTPVCTGACPDGSFMCGCEKSCQCCSTNQACSCPDGYAHCSSKSGLF